MEATQQQAMTFFEHKKMWKNNKVRNFGKIGFKYDSNKGT